MGMTCRFRPKTIPNWEDVCWMRREGKMWFIKSQTPDESCLCLEPQTATFFLDRYVFINSHFKPQPREKLKEGLLNPFISSGSCKKKQPFFFTLSTVHLTVNDPYLGPTFSFSLCNTYHCDYIRNLFLVLRRVGVRSTSPLSIPRTPRRVLNPPK